MKLIQSKNCRFNSMKCFYKVVENIMNDTDLGLFTKEMAGVLPLNTDAKIIVKKLSADKVDSVGQQYRREQAAFEKGEIDCPLSLVLRKKLDADEWLSYKRNGIQSAVFKNLRIGKYALETTLNINKKRPEQVRNELLQFVADCQEMDIRSVLICYGQGHHATLLKSYLAQWLPELPDVQAFYTAQKHHGGLTSVYVLLRKSEQKRQQNRERHAARLGSEL